MTTADKNRWLISFADLTLLLLGFFVLLYAQKGDQDAVVSSISHAFDQNGPVIVEKQFVAASIFQPGEAVLKTEAREQLLILAGKMAAKQGTIAISSTGRDGDTPRFDSWELAAARAAVLGRLLRQQGFATNAIDIIIPPTPQRTMPKGQILVIRHQPGR